MDRLDGFLAWFQAHKAVLGGFCLGLSTVLIGAGQMYGWSWATTAGGLLTLIGTTLIGAGTAKSDQFYRDRAEVIETRKDRRQTSKPIPATDLEKLEGKVEGASKADE